eukprot:61868_1
MASFVTVYILILTCLSYLVLIPIGAWFTWRYYQHRNNILLKRRYNAIALSQNIFTLLFILFSTSIPCELTGIISVNLFHLVLASAYGVAYSLFSRLWLNYFEINYDRTVHEHEWDHILNHAYTNTEAALQQAVASNFFIKHKSRLGNPTFIFKLSAICWFISVLIPFCLWTPWEFHTASAHYRQSREYEIRVALFMYLALIEGVVPYILIGIIRYKTPRFLDHLLIREEIKYLLHTVVSMVCIIVVFTTIYVSVSMPGSVEDILISTAYFLLNCASLISVLISTWWVLASLDPYLSDAGPPTPRHALLLRNALLNEEIFYGFVVHLRHEFSLELLMAFYEMVYFKKYIKICYPNELLENKLSANDLLFEFNENLAKPMMTYKMREEDNTEIIAEYDELKQMAHYIYTKYIVRGCDLEINISYQLNQGYVALMNDGTTWLGKTQEEISVYDLYVLYHDCIVELYRLLDQSYLRFKGRDVILFSASMDKGVSK